MAETDKACQNLPPVTTHGYTPKGTFTELAGLKIYTTGPHTSSRGLVSIYDIFGLAPQTLQGADRLASSLNVLVLMPDFFHGKPVSMSVFPPDTDEKKKTLQKFREQKADIDKNGAVLREVIRAAKGAYTGIGRWGVYGLCWGGKLAVLAGGEKCEFAVAGTAHPGRLVREDAERLTIPFICLFSKEDGTPELMKEYQEALEKKGGNVVETYGTMRHGWMGARADFENEASVKEYERGYEQLASFFAAHL